MKCVFKQTYRNMEILLIDDGSTDGSGELCDDYAHQDSRIRVFHIPNSGVAAARNLGLREYTGEYLIFADVDDLFSSNYVGRLCELISGSGYHVATCMQHNTRDIELDDYEYEEKNEPVECIWGEIDYTTRESRRVIWGAIYDRFAVDGISFDEQYTVSTDTLFFAQVLRHVGKHLHTADELYCYVIYEKSLSHRKYGRVRYDEIRVWERIYDMLPAGSVSRKTTVKTLIKKYKKGMKELLKENREADLFDEMCSAVAKHKSDRNIYEKRTEEMLFRAFTDFPSAYMRSWLFLRNTKALGKRLVKGRKNEKSSL